MLFDRVQNKNLRQIGLGVDYLISDIQINKIRSRDYSFKNIYKENSDLKKFCRESLRKQGCILSVPCTESMHENALKLSE